MMHFKVIFHLDGTGAYYDLREPTHLDALLVYSVGAMQAAPVGPLNRDDPINHDFQIPLLRSKINGYRIWHGSAIMPEGDHAETVRYWRKRFRQDRVHTMRGNPHLSRGTYREYNMPVPLIMVDKLVAYASGNRKRTRKLLEKNIHTLGKKRAYGYGRIVRIETEETPDDWSMIKDGRAMRWLPGGSGTVLVRTVPPYWNSNDRVPCCAVGEEWK